jgi:hypothetical protein
MLYFAYGSNLNVEAMRRRCPAARPLERLVLPNSRLVFRGVADCIEEPGARCYGGVWKITAACERALDRYEGIGSGMYRKVYMSLENVPGERELMFYQMNSTGIFPPSVGYFETIRQGYRDFRIPVRFLFQALAASWDEKNPSHVERQRYARTGRPRLAALPVPTGLSGLGGKARAAGPRLESNQLFKRSV